MLSVQFGAALAVPVMRSHGSFGVTALRLACAAVLLMAIVRPRILQFSRRQWLGAMGLGAATAVMTLSFFEAVTLIPIGPAVTIDFLGPLAVSVVALRGVAKLVLPVLAAAGIAAISYGGGWLFDPVGIVFALSSGCGWAAYIVLTRHVGRLFSRQDGLALSLMFAACLALLLVFFAAPGQLGVARLPVAAGLALLAPLLPFSLEMMALRRMDMGAFSILMSLEPAVGAVFGFLILRQVLAVQQILGVAAVMAASVAAVYLTAFKAKPGAV